MPQAARRTYADAPRRRGGHLSVVAKARPARKPARVSARARDARCRAVFNAVLGLVIAVTALGLVRVAVVARAAEMTLSEGRLAADIKVQRSETDRLETDRGALSRASRIEEIASATMGMGRPVSVSYISMPVDRGTVTAKSPGAVSGAARASAGGGEAFSAVLEALMAMSAGEAQTLLVGDVGLAGSR